MSPPPPASTPTGGEALLRALAEEAGGIDGWSGYAAYCRDRARGLRKPAMRSLSAFIEDAGEWPEAERRAFTRWLCARLERDAEPHHDATPQPLVERVLRPALEAWTEDDATDPLPHRWLGTLFDGWSHVRRDDPAATAVDEFRHLRTAIELDPDEQPSRIRLVERLIDLLWYATHHLPEYFIGDPAEQLETADEALAVTGGIRDVDVRARLQDGVAWQRGLIEDWLAFQGAGGDDFAEWCAQRGRDYEWVRHYHFPGR